MLWFRGFIISKYGNEAVRFLYGSQNDVIFLLLEESQTPRVTCLKSMHHVIYVFEFSNSLLVIDFRMLLLTCKTQPGLCPFKTTVQSPGWSPWEQTSRAAPKAGVIVIAPQACLSVAPSTCRINRLGRLGQLAFLRQVWINFLWLVFLNFTLHEHFSLISRLWCWRTFRVATPNVHCYLIVLTATKKKNYKVKVLHFKSVSRG